MSREAFAGIDVAFAEHKRLPICIAVKDATGRLTPLPLRRRRDLLPPRGGGYRRIVDPAVVEDFAQAALRYLQQVEQAEDVRIKTLAIDASRDYKRAGDHRRACEEALGRRGIRYYPTPSQAEFDDIIAKVRRHFREGGAPNKTPHANQLWMLAGFALHRVLARHYRCLEVFPQAIVRTLRTDVGHKSRRDGLRAQLAAVAAATSWPPDALGRQLTEAGYGALHDRLDAYMAAWVASLPDTALDACGNPPDDVIWLPRMAAEL